jgi:solute:Na+ symporter, SSS family
MAVAVSLTPTYPLQVAGYVFPGYTALYAAILNVALVVVLTPLFNTVSGRRRPLDATVSSDYHGATIDIRLRERRDQRDRQLAT